MNLYGKSCKMSEKELAGHSNKKHGHFSHFTNRPLNFSFIQPIQSEKNNR